MIYLITIGKFYSNVFRILFDVFEIKVENYINKLNHFAEALKQYGSRITEYERREIEAYPEIYYLGLDARKIHGEEGAQLNGGFDDENGSYNKVS